MINSEVLEIKKQFKHENCSITKFSGCYVDGEKEIKYILAESGVDKEKLDIFDKKHDQITGDNIPLLASNVANSRVFEVKTPDVVIKVNPDRGDLIETKMVDGRKCLVIEINDQVEVNGIPVNIGSNPISE